MNRPFHCAAPNGEFCGQCTQILCRFDKSVNARSIKVGGKYNWKGQPERLVYMGGKQYPDGYWHQFCKVDELDKVWCEVRGADLQRFEETK